MIFFLFIAHFTFRAVYDTFRAVNSFIKVIFDRIMLKNGAYNIKETIK